MILEHIVAIIAYVLVNISLIGIAVVAYKDGKQLKPINETGIILSLWEARQLQRQLNSIFSNSCPK